MRQSKCDILTSVHKGQKNPKCESCGKSFSKAKNLKRHIHTVHEDHKEHICESCNKSFTAAVTLITHIYTVQFMQATKPTNVFLVVNHFLWQEI